MERPDNRLSDYLRTERFEGLRGALDASDKDGPRVFFFTGYSMSPVLKPCDIIYVFPYVNRNVCVGDVVVYRLHGEKIATVHRIVSTKRNLITTRGDNNPAVDPCLFTADSILGRVVYVQTATGRRYIHGGLPGRLVGVTMRTRASLAGQLCRLVRPIYRWLVRSRILALPKIVRLPTRIIHYRRPTGTELQLLVGDTVAGRLPAEKDQWEIHAPFSLWFDDGNLPQLSQLRE